MTRSMLLNLRRPARMWLYNCGSYFDSCMRGNGSWVTVYSVVYSLTMKHTRVVSLNARQAMPEVHLANITRACFIVKKHTTEYIHLCDWVWICFHCKFGDWLCSLYYLDWRNLLKNVLLFVLKCFWKGSFGCAIVMSHTGINKTVSQWPLTFNLFIYVTWPLICAFCDLHAHPWNLWYEQVCVW